MAKRIAGFLAALALLAATASCSSSDISSGGSPGTVNALLIGQFQSPSSFSFPEMEDGAAAAVAAANASGGIDGHKIDLATCNDQGDPNIAGDCARQAVQDHVVAVIGSISEYGANILPLLQAAQIPYIGEVPLSAADFTNPDSYPIDGGSPAVFGALGAVLVTGGCKKVGLLYTADSAASKVSSEITAAAARGAGGQVVASVGVPESAPDASAPVSTAIQAGAQCLSFSLDAAQAAQVIVAVRQSGRPGMELSTSLSSLTSDAIDGLNGAANGVLVAQAAYLPGAKTPAFLAQMKSYRPKALVDSNSEYAWSAATAFIEVARKVSGTLTGSTLGQQLNRTTDLSVSTYPTPIYFAKPNPVSQYSRVFNTWQLIYRVKGDGYVLDRPDPIDVRLANS
jgi:ABC-type branched-subunit amino acid transport system substrate-binding protein